MAEYSRHNNDEQVGYNLLGQRSQQLATLNNRAVNSFLNGKADDYFFSLIALRQNLTPNLSSRETRVLNKLERNIHQLKRIVQKQQDQINRDEPGFNIVSRFRKHRMVITRNVMSEYVQKIKKFERALLIVMKKKGFYPGKADGSDI